MVFLEALLREPAPVMARVCGHLGLDPGPLAGATLPHANQGNFPRWPRLAALGQQLQRLTSAAGPGAARVIQSLGRATRPLRVYSGQPRMHDDTRSALRERLRQSDLELADWLGRPPPWRSG